jgi:hypothetical protein
MAKEKRLVERNSCKSKNNICVKIVGDNSYWFQHDEDMILLDAFVNTATNFLVP